MRKINFENCSSKLNASQGAHWEGASRGKTKPSMGGGLYIFWPKKIGPACFCYGNSSSSSFSSSPSSSSFFSSFFFFAVFIFFFLLLHTAAVGRPGWKTKLRTCRLKHAISSVFTTSFYGVGWHEKGPIDIPDRRHTTAGQIIDILMYVCRTGSEILLLLSIHPSVWEASFSRPTMGKTITDYTSDINVKFWHFRR